MSQTPNHTYEQPAKGTQDWHQPLNDNFANLDTDVEIRDADGNRSQYQAKPGAKFFATDTGNVYIGDGSSWNRLASSGQSPTFESRQVNQVGSKVTAGTNQTLPDGTEKKLQFDNVVYDDLGDFVMADDQFELSRPGVYHARVEITWNLSVGQSSVDFLETTIDPGDKARELEYTPDGQFPDTHLGVHFKVTGDPLNFNKLSVKVKQENGGGESAEAGGHLSVVHLG